MPKHDNVNIYLSTTDTQKLENGSSKNEMYLIMTYDKMRQDYDNQKKCLVKFESDIAALEDDNDHMERSIQNLRGYVKNMSELAKLNKSISDKYKAYQADTESIAVANYQIIKSMITKNIAMMFIISVAYFLLWAFDVIYFEEIVFNLGIVLPIVGIYTYGFRQNYWCVANMFKRVDVKHTMYYNIKQTYVTAINNKLEEIVEITKGNDFLNDLVDLV